MALMAKPPPRKASAGKQFFFEKKNQKTFCFEYALRASAALTTKPKFFVSFFQKRNTSLLHSCVNVYAD